MISCKVAMIALESISAQYTTYSHSVARFIVVMGYLGLNTGYLIISWAELYKNIFFSRVDGCLNKVSDTRSSYS